MKIEMNGSIYEGDYVDIIRQMKDNNAVGKSFSLFEFADDVEYLMLRFFDRDVYTETTYLEEKCEGLVKELLRKGLAKRLD